MFSASFLSLVQGVSIAFDTIYQPDGQAFGRLLKMMYIYIYSFHQFHVWCRCQMFKAFTPEFKITDLLRTHTMSSGPQEQALNIYNGVSHVPICIYCFRVFRVWKSERSTSGRPYCFSLGPATERMFWWRRPKAPKPGRTAAGRLVLLRVDGEVPDAPWVVFFRQEGYLGTWDESGSFCTIL